jgi:UDP-N-acetylglucosamine--N-acetylmuramyl-(pentapeptide) pyrophosphoryl-undecaprenol N-acetylglucosamine transferase
VAGGGGLLVDDAELSPEWIYHNLVPLLSDADRVAHMSDAAARLGRRDADVTLARMVYDVVRQAHAAQAGQ